MEVKHINQYHHARVLCIVAHADDESLFCGGLLRKLADQHCEIGIVVCTSVAETNAAPEGVDDIARQQRRLVAFGRACGIIGVSRTWLLNCHNCHEGYDVDDSAAEIRYRLCDIVLDFAPAMILTHGTSGEYGHEQHKATHKAVTGLIGDGPLWTFSATGHAVPVDLAWKKRLLDCYRIGTTQDAYWSPYFRKPDSPLEPWLGEVERFECVS